MKLRSILLGNALLLSTVVFLCSLGALAQGTGDWMVTAISAVVTIALLIWVEKGGLE